MGIRPPVTIEGEQNLCGLEVLQDGKRLAPHGHARNRYGEQTTEHGGNISLQFALRDPHRRPWGDRMQGDMHRSARPWTMMVGRADIGIFRALSRVIST